MPLINCEVELILTWSAGCVIIYTDVENQVPTFTITETNLYVPVVTLSTQGNSKLLPQLKNGFKRTITWNKYLVKPELLARNEPLGLTAAASAADIGIHNTRISRRHSSFSASSNATLIISNKDMEDLIKVEKSLEDSGLLLNGVTELVKNEVKEQPGGFLSMLRGTLGGKFVRKPFSRTRNI